MKYSMYNIYRTVVSYPFLFLSQDADELVALIGKEESMKIIDFFEKSLDGLTIDSMYLARHGVPIDSLFTSPWHKDDYATMEIALNDNFDGGQVLHLNETGVYKNKVRPGYATGKHIGMIYLEPILCMQIY